MGGYLVGREGYEKLKKCENLAKTVGEISLSLLAYDDSQLRESLTVVQIILEHLYLYLCPRYCELRVIGSVTYSLQQHRRGQAVCQFAEFS